VIPGCEKADEGWHVAGPRWIDWTRELVCWSCIFCDKVIASWTIEAYEMAKLQRRLEDNAH
jgi:hypothetical protein